MAHVGEGDLLAYLDQELPAGRRTAVMRHLASCTACAAGLERLRASAELFSGSLRQVDEPAPVASALAAVRTRLAERPVRSVPAFRARRALMRAAMLVLGLGAAASAAVPGSPVRSWVADAWRQALTLFEGAETVTPVPEAAPVPVAPAELPAVSGVAILPSNGAVRIVLTEPQQGVDVRVRFVADDRATVSAAGARFESGAGRLDVIGAQGGVIRIDLPRLLRAAVVEVDGQVYLAKDGDQLRFPNPPAYRSGAEVLFRLD